MNFDENRCSIIIIIIISSDFVSEEHVYGRLDVATSRDIGLVLKIM